MRNTAARHAVRRREAGPQGEPHLLAAEVERRLGLPSGVLAEARERGDGPDFEEAGNRTAVYQIGVVQRWLARCERRPAGTDDRPEPPRAA
jgi:hypothetical protein